MDASQILKADLNDLIFAGKHKDYGAYDIRRRYPKHVRNATLGAVLFFSLVFLSPVIYRYFNPPEDMHKKKEAVKPTKLGAPPSIDHPAPPPPKVKLPPPPKKIVFIPPIVTPQDVPDDQQMPDNTTPPAPPAPPTPPDDSFDFGSAPPPGPIGPDPNANKVFTFVEQMPTFPGGDQALQNYLGNNIKYPAAARENSIEGLVVLTFVVDENGKISDIKALRELGGGCTDEAIRVVRSMPAWKAGKQNGNPVKVQFNLPVHFQLSGE